jgi:hypothetical protein
MTARVLAVACAAVLAMGAGGEPRPPAMPAASAGDPELAAAASAWNAAERAAAKRPPLEATVVEQAWAKAGAAYAAIATSSAKTLTAADRAEAAYAWLLASWRAERHDDVIAAAGVVLDRGATGEDAMWAHYLRGVVRHRKDDKGAIADLGEVVRHHRTHAIAGLAAPILLDALNRAQDWDAFVAWTELMLADAAFLAAHEDLAATLRRIHVQAELKTAEGHVVAGRYEQCAEAYLAAAADPHAEPRHAVEARYNAAVCLEKAREPERAVATYRTIVDAYPRDRLSARALAAIAAIEGALFRFEAAADAAEAYARRYPAEKDAVDALSDSFRWRMALGQYDRAGRVLDTLAKRDGTSPAARRSTAEGSAALAAALLGRGERKAAAARVRALVRMPGLAGLDAWGALYAAEAIAEVACPVALVAELCPKSRDAALVRVAHQLLARATSRSSSGFGYDPDHVAERRRLDLELEPILAARAPKDRSTVDRVRAGYVDLTTAIHDADTRVIAHARLGQLDLHVRDDVRAIEDFRACVALGRAETAAADFIALCERNLASLKFPDPDQLPERLPVPSLSPARAIEGATVGPSRP